MQTDDVIIKGAIITPEKLKECGWKFSHGIGNLEAWKQAGDILFYDPKTQKIDGVYQSE